MFRYVIANDLSPSATEIMRRNVLFNGLGPQDATEVTEPEEENPTSSVTPRVTQKPSLGKVRVNEGDAWLVIPQDLFKNIVLHILQFTHVCSSCGTTTGRCRGS